MEAKLKGYMDVLQRAASTPVAQSDVDLRLKNQKVLDDNIALLDVPAAKIQALADGLSSIVIAANGIEGNAILSDTAPDDKNYQLETWVLNYTNKLLPTAERVGADTLKPEDAFHFGGIADPSAKQPIVTLTVQFQATSRIELSTGLMIPFSPYHSYTKSSDANGNAAYRRRQRTLLSRRLLSIIVLPNGQSGSKRPLSFSRGASGLTPRRKRSNSVRARPIRIVRLR